jgi:hypothetical protein
MGKESVWRKVKNCIASIAFSVFLWGVEMSDDEYRAAIISEHDAYMS